MRARWLWLGWLLLWLGLAGAAIEGQSAGDLIVLRGGDLWVWRAGQLERLTQDGYVHLAVLSPDGAKIAYRSASNLVVHESESPVVRGNGLSDVWVWNLETGTAKRVTNYPIEEGGPYIEQVSVPAWSPDSTRLAWVHGAIMIHDLTTGATTVFSRKVDYGFQDAGIAEPSVQWGSHISLDAFSFGYDDGTHMLFVYDGDGTPHRYAIGSIHYSEDSAGATCYQGSVEFHRWVRYEGDWWMALWLERGEIHLLNPVTGARLRLEESPTLQPVTIYPDSLQLRPLLEAPFWEIVEPDGTIAPVENSRFSCLRSPVLSPDGRTIAYLTESTLRLWRSGGITEDFPRDSIEQLIWGPVIWRTSSVARPLPAPTPFVPPTPSMG